MNKNERKRKYIYRDILIPEYDKEKLTKRTVQHAVKVHVTTTIIIFI
jgi:hypothetical protein